MRPQAHDESTALLVPLFICTVSTLAVRIACFALHFLPWPLSYLRWLADCAAAAYLLDLISGVFHACADVAEPQRRDVGRSFGEVRALGTRYVIIDVWRRIVCNFQAHAEHDSEALVETACVATPLLLVTILQRAVGWLADGPWRVWLLLLTLAHGVQASHFQAHKRVHEGAGNLAPLIVWLQDKHLLLHPDLHRARHKSVDANFCFFNGWANAAVNAGFRLARQHGLAEPKATLHTARDSGAGAPTAARWDDRTSQDDAFELEGGAAADATPSSRGDGSEQQRLEAIRQKYRPPGSSSAAALRQRR